MSENGHVMRLSRVARCGALSSIVPCLLAAAARVSPDDLMITLYEAPGENFSFGRGEAQRANAVPREQKSHAS